MCFDGDAPCIAKMESIAARASYFARFEFELQSTLLGQPGATERFTALMVPPSAEPEIMPSPATSSAEDFSAASRAPSRANLSGKDGRTCARALTWQERGGSSTVLSSARNAAYCKASSMSPDSM
jgi:hypothetical protein